MDQVTAAISRHYCSHLTQVGQMSEDSGNIRTSGHGGRGSLGTGRGVEIGCRIRPSGTFHSTQEAVSEMAAPQEDCMGIKRL